MTQLSPEAIAFLDAEALERVADFGDTVENTVAACRIASVAVTAKDDCLSLLAKNNAANAMHSFVALQTLVVTRNALNKMVPHVPDSVKDDDPIQGLKRGSGRNPPRTLDDIDDGAIRRGLRMDRNYAPQNIGDNPGFAEGVTDDDILNSYKDGLPEMYDSPEPALPSKVFRDAIASLIQGIIGNCTKEGMLAIAMEAKGMTVEDEQTLIAEITNLAGQLEPPSDEQLLK